MPRHLVAYHGNRYLDHFARDLEDIVDHGFNGIVHCVTEADLEWSMDRVADIFGATRDAGLECWADPWGVGGVFGGEAHSGFLARHPDAHQVTSTGRSLPLACLRHPEFLRYMETWVGAMAVAGADTIFWDEPHAGRAIDGWACACDACRVETGEPVPPQPDDRVLDSRVATALGFLDHMSAHAASKGLRNSVCLYPLPPAAAREEGLPRIEDVASLAHVDGIAVDPYPVFLLMTGRGYDVFDAERFVGRWADRLQEIAAAAGITAHLWIQGFALPRGYERLIGECAAVARAHGLHDLAFWSYRASEAGVAMPSEDPAACWAAARDAFRI